MSTASWHFCFPAPNDYYLLCEKAIMTCGTFACQWLFVSPSVCRLELVIRGSHNTISTLVLIRRQTAQSRYICSVSVFSLALFRLSVPVLPFFLVIVYVHCSFAHLIDTPCRTLSFCEGFSRSLIPVVLKVFFSDWHNEHKQCRIEKFLINWLMHAQPCHWHLDLSNFLLLTNNQVDNQRHISSQL